MNAESGRNQDKKNLQTGKLPKTRSDDASRESRYLRLRQGALNRGFSFYEPQNPELGSYFLDSLFVDIDSLTIYAGIHPFSNGYQRRLSRRFPFAIYYLIQGEEVRVKQPSITEESHPSLKGHSSESKLQLGRTSSARRGSGLVQPVAAPNALRASCRLLGAAPAPATRHCGCG